MEEIEAFTRPVIFTLSLNFIFGIFHPLTFANYLFHDSLLDSHNPCAPPFIYMRLLTIKGLKMDTPTKKDLE